MPWIGVGFIGFIILLSLLWIIISIFLCIWVYRDAKARGEEAVLWLIVVLIANIIGLIIWLIVRPEKKSGRRGRMREGLKYCQNCGAEISSGAKYCPECGEEIG